MSMEASTGLDKSLRKRMSVGVKILSYALTVVSIVVRIAWVFAKASIIEMGRDINRS